MKYPFVFVFCFLIFGICVAQEPISDSEQFHLWLKETTTKYSEFLDKNQLGMTDKLMTVSKTMTSLSQNIRNAAQTYQSAEMMYSAIEADISGLSGRFLGYNVTSVWDIATVLEQTADFMLEFDTIGFWFPNTQWSTANFLNSVAYLNESLITTKKNYNSMVDYWRNSGKGPMGSYYMVNAGIQERVAELTRLTHQLCVMRGEIDVASKTLKVAQQNKNNYAGDEKIDQLRMGVERVSKLRYNYLLTLDQFNLVIADLIQLFDEHLFILRDMIDKEVDDQIRKNILPQSPYYNPSRGTPTYFHYREVYKG